MGPYRKFQPTDPLICISYIHAVVALYIYMIGLLTAMKYSIRLSYPTPRSFGRLGGYILKSRRSKQDSILQMKKVVRQLY